VLAKRTSQSSSRSNNESVLNQIILDYLQKMGYNYAASVFSTEASISQVFFFFPLFFKKKKRKKKKKTEKEKERKSSNLNLISFSFFFFFFLENSSNF